MDRLDALRTKYARAQEHRAEGSRALDEWDATLPYGVRGEAEPSGWFVITTGSPESLRRRNCRSFSRT